MYENLVDKIWKRKGSKFQNFHYIYTNFTEVGTTVFSKYAINKFMEYYDPILIGWGIDYFYIWVLGIDKTDKYAVIDSIQCINPHDDNKKIKAREHTNIENHNKEQEFWIQVQNKYNIPDWQGNKTFLTIPYSN